MRRIYPEGDNDYKRGRITNVEKRNNNYIIEDSANPLGILIIPKSENIKPRIGQSIRYYGKCENPRGIFINQKQISYFPPTSLRCVAKSGTDKAKIKRR